jgi:ribosome-binding factor A
MSKRILRINQLLKNQVSQVLLRDFEPPVGVLVTVTRVETSSDLSQTKVFVSVVPKEKQQIVISALSKKIFRLQQELNKKMKIRPVPKIRFVKEKKTEEAERIEQILQKLKKEQK